MGRDLSLDIIRIVACMMVIVMHAPMPTSEGFSPLLSGISYLTAPSIGLFFMISGALILKTQVRSGGDVRRLLIKRVSKVFFPLIFWELFGFMLNRTGISNSETGILWFLYSLIGLYLLSPILIRWISEASQQEIEFYLIIWGISLCVPFLSSFFPLAITPSSWLYYFYGYLGYFVLGYYLDVYDLNRKRRFLILAFFIAFSLGLPICNLLCDWGLDFFQCFCFLSLPVIFQCIVWWKMLHRINHWFHCCSSLIAKISKLTFGVYLIHIFILRNLFWNVDWIGNMNYILQIPIDAILTMVFSWLIVWGISKVKGSKYIIGI